MTEFLTLSSWQALSIARSSSGEVFCYLGYRQESQPANDAYYGLRVAIQDSVSPTDRRFVRLIGGTLTLEPFLAPDEPIQLIENHFLALPKGSNSFFGVLDDSTWIDKTEITEQLFGATYPELMVVIDCFGKLTGRNSDSYFKAGRVTFSRTRNNYCDISGCLIPSEFPYLAFEQSPYAWSHVSLYGFYRLLALMCSNRGQEPIYRGLLNLGVESSVLDRLIAAGSQDNEPIRQSY